jgi:hypothetical protein
MRNEREGSPEYEPRPASSDTMESEGGQRDKEQYLIGGGGGGKEHCK